ncbi:MAG: hypothetical protein II632_03805, partial [Bacteroidales bacterium]|nr:hypothetical protein [Bacteroidales bacterium]
MRNSKVISFCVLVIFLVTGCYSRDVRPAGDHTDRTSFMFPDYQEVTIPCNIAPLNFYYTDPDLS